MNLNLFNKHKKNNSKELFNNTNNKNGFLINFLTKLKKYLESFSYEIYTLDSFKGNFAICENRKTKEMVNIPLDKLPINAYEESILRKQDDNYIVDDFLTKRYRQSTKEKFNSLLK